ncbi:MAG: class I SAM-dependent methyltransferase [Acidiferrobacteraceae bacterium]
MNETEIQAFWQHHPCGEMMVGGLERYRNQYENFFADYDRSRYIKVGHILGCLDNIEFGGRRTLEIGLGQGADSEQIIRRGAAWSGVDLTEESIKRVGLRLNIRKLPYRELKQGSVLELPFDDRSFDIVFSHGVLHHVPDIHKAQREISRVLRPDGTLIVMLYAKYSLNYLVAISLMRRLGLIGLALFKPNAEGIYGDHLANVRKMGLRRYLRLEHFIHANTDGPMNPYSKVYDRALVTQDFPDFTIERIYKRFMHAPPLPVARLPLGRAFGWHLWVHLKPNPRL